MIFPPDNRGVSRALLKGVLKIHFCLRYAQLTISATFIPFFMSCEFVNLNSCFNNNRIKEVRSCLNLSFQNSFNLLTTESWKWPFPSTRLAFRLRRPLSFSSLKQFLFRSQACKEVQRFSRLYYVTNYSQETDIFTWGDCLRLYWLPKERGERQIQNT